MCIFVTGLGTINVRRKLYKPTSPAGRGTKWEWASSGKDWISYNMEVQCIIEEAWAKVAVNQQPFSSFYF